MTQISVISKESHQVLEQVDSNRVGLTQNSVVVVKVPKEDVASITRDGNNAVITLKSGETIVIENYFAGDKSDNSLVFESDDGSLFWAKFTDANGAIADVIQYQPLAEIEPLLYKDSLVGAVLPWALGAAGIGAVGAAINNGSSDNNDGTPVAVKKLSTLVVTDNVEPKTGQLTAGSATNDKTPVVSGTGAEPGATIKVYDGNQLVAETVAKADGSWSVKLPKELADGDHSISATQTVDGVEGPKSDALNFTVDTQDPTVSINDLGDTNDTTPTISGKTNEPKAEIDVVIKDKNGNVVDSGKANVDDQGNWNYTPSKPLPEGEYKVEVTAKDPAGNESTQDKGGLVVDTTDPTITIDPLTPTGDTTPTITGKTDPDATVDVVIKDKDGNIVDTGKGTVDGNGDWSYTPSKPLPEGPYEVEVTAKDPAGNDKTVTDKGLDVDTSLPVISIDPLKPTNDATPTVTGKTESGTTVNVEIKDATGKVVDSGSATVDANGNWTYTPSKTLPDGAYTVDATAKDAAGNPSTATDKGLSVDTQAPTISINPLAPTNDTTPTVSGKTEAGATVNVEIKDATGKVVESGPATVDGNGNWSYTPSTTLPDGAYTVDATAKDAAGNPATATDKGLAVDTQAPTISINPLAPTNDNTPTISGKTESGATVNVEIKDPTGKVVESGPATVDGNGNWSYTPANPLPEGPYTVDATAKDPAGNPSTATEKGLDVNTSALTVSIDPLKPTQDTTPDISGKTAAGATVTVEVKDSTGKVVATGPATVDANGHWTYTPSTALAEGNYTVAVEAVNAANTKANATATGLIVDTTLPAVTIDHLVLTNDATPTVKGTTEKGATVTVEVKDATGTVVDSGPATVDANGNWTYTPSKTLPDGAYTVDATAKDAAGNPATATDNGLVVDTTPPTVTIDTLGLTNATSPIIKGTAEAGATVVVDVRDATGTVIDSGKAQVDSNGNWTFTPNKPLIDGSYTIEATAIDAAGNPDTAIDSGLKIDTVPPTVDIDNLFGAASARMLMSVSSTTSASLPQTNQIKPTFSGNSTKSVEVMIYLQDESGKTVDSGLAKLDTATGKWTYTPSQNLAEGYYMLQAISKDAAGNQSAPAAKAFIVDTQAPVVDVDDVGLTNDATPDVKGKVNEPTSTVTVKVADSTGKVLETGIATVASDGKWSYTVKASLPDGDYVVSATAKDKAGNTSVEDTATAKIDTAVPTSTLTVSPTGEVVITFSEAVKGFDKSDVTVNGGTLVGLTQQADGSWKGQVVADGTTGTSGKVDVAIADGSYTDLAGNNGKGSSANGVDVPSVDSTAPTANIVISPEGEVIITFSEPVKGFDASDVKVAGGTLQGLTQQADGSWTGHVVANGNTGALGKVDLTIPAGSYTDLANNPGVVANQSQSVPSIDTTAPTPTITLTPAGDVTITFSEPVKGFDASDVNVDKGKLVSLTEQPDGSWTGKVVADGNTGAPATVVVSINAGSYTDVANNPGNGAFKVGNVPSIDTTAPTSTVTLDANGDLNITFSEAVKGFDATDVKVTGGTVSGLVQQADGSWTGKVVANGNTGALGKVTVSVADDSYTDLAGNNGKGSNASNDIASIDTTAPTATIVITPAGEVTISFSEPVKDFTASDLVVAGGTVTGLIQQPDGTWKGQVVSNDPTGAPGQVDITIPAGSYTDNAGNPGQTATGSQSVPGFDTVAPTSTMTLDADGNLKITFSEEIKGFDVNDVKVTGGTVSGLAQQADGSWTAKVVADGNTGAPGLVTVTVADNSYTDLAGNNGKGSKVENVSVPSIDTTAPTSTMTLDADGNLKITFSEAVKGFDATDVKVTGGTVSGLAQQADGSWTAKVVADGNTGAPGLVTVTVADNSYTDLAGNNGIGSKAENVSVPSVDTTAPTATIVITPAGDVTITFSEPVKGFDPTDVKVVGGTVSGLTQQADGSWTGKVVADGNTGALGNVDLTIPAGSYTDNAGNPGTVANQSQSVPSIDTTAPTSTMTLDADGNLKITFSEAVKGFDATDVKVTGGTVSGLTQQTDGSWTGKVVADGNTGAPGLVTVTVADNSYTDLAGNNGIGSKAENVSVPSVDTTAPTSTIILDANGDLKITFSEAVKGFDATDVKVAGGTVSGLTQQADGSWTGKVVADGNTGALGTVTVSVADDSYTDLAGNNGKGNSASKDIPSIDTTAPTSTMTLDADGNLKITFSEAVKGFDATDVKVTGGTVSGLTQQTDGSWTGKVVADGNTGAPGLVTVTVADNSYTDLAGNNGIGSKAENVSVPSVDTTAPTSTITLDANGDLKITFSEAVKGFDATDVKVAGGTVSGLTQQADGSWTGKVVANGNTGALGTVTVSVADDSYTDLAGNNGKGNSASKDIPSIDTTAPTSTMTLDADGNLKITFSEAVKGFDATDVKVAGGTVSGLAQQADGSWTGKVVADGNTGAPGLVTVTVADNSYTDLAGNNGIGSKAENVSVPSVDTTAPTSTITLDANGDLKITFSEAVKGFDATDVKVTGGTVSGLAQQADGSWTGHVVANGNTGALGTVTVSVDDNSYTDLAGNNGKGNSASKDIPSIDTTAPTSTVTLDANGNLKITFSEAVKGFDATDVKVAGGTVSGLAQQADGSWTGKVVADGNTGAIGTVTVSVADNSYTDLAGNNGKGDSASNDIASVDTTAPTATIVITPAGEVTISFSEPVKDFTPSDLVVAGGTVSGLTQQPDGSWTGHVVSNDPQGAPGQVDITIPAGSYTDNAGNPGQLAIGSQTVPGFDTIAPTSTVTLDANGNLKITFSEPVKGFDATDVKVTGGTVSGLAQQADGSWTGHVVANGNTGALGTVTVSVDDNSYTDLAGNNGKGNSASNDIASVDTTAPSVTVAFDVNGTLVINFSEPVIGFDASDVTVLGGTLNNFVKVSDTQWTALVKGNGTAAIQTVEVSIANGTYTDKAGNLGTGTSVKGDITLPTVEIDPFDFFAAPAAAPVMKFAARTLLAAEPLPPATNNPKQTFNGSSMNSVEVKINIYDANNNLVESGQAVLNTSTGRWSYTPTQALADGQFRLEAISKDVYGVTSAPANISFIVDTVKPTIDIDDAGVVSDATPSFSGKTEANATVTVTVKDAAGTVLASGAAVVATDGSWTYTAPNLADGTYKVEVVAKDRAGNLSDPDSTNVTVDTVAQLDALTVTANPDGTATITGKSEPGATVTVKDPNGNDLKVTVNPDGTFSAVAPAPAAEGTYTATAKDAAGNSSTSTADLDDNVAPVVTVDITPNADGTATVTGKTEPGATVSVKDPAGNNVPVTVNPDGTYTATVPAPAAEGTYTATATDKAGNVGTGTDVLVDNVAPTIVNLDVTPNADGTASITGKTEPGATVSVKDPAGNNVPVTVNPDGTFTATVPAPAPEGTYTATATDKAGNTGTATDVLDDNIGPQVTVDITPNADGTATVTGKTEPGATVSVKDPAGNNVPVTVNPDGTYTATVPAPAPEGTYTVTATDKAGNPSTATDDLADNVAPTVVIDVVSNPDGTASITGKTEPGATVSVKDPAGNNVPVTVNPDGTYTATVPATAAEGTYTATATDKAGNAGTATDTLVDTSLPSILTAQVDAQTGAFVTGKAQPGSSVTVYTEDGKTVLGTGTVDASGQYSVALNPAQVDGETVKVTAKDPGGESVPVTATAPDLYAPDAPTAQVAADGKSVTGVTEPNAIVQVYGGSKGTTVIGTTVAGADGKYTVPLNPALVDGETVKVTAKDPGGESLATPANAPDLYAPDAPTATINSKGDTVTGTAEANSVIKVYAPDGTTVIAQGNSDANGNYSIKLPTALTDGQTLLVSASDGGGESGKTGTKAPNITVDAVDNLVDAGINFNYPVVDTRSTKLFNESSILNIGTKTYTGNFSVGENEVGNATISVTTGSLINLFDKAEMKLYKLNDDGTRTLLGSNKDSGLFDLLGIFGESTQVKVNNLLPGKYAFEFTGGSFLGAFTSIKADLSLQVLDTSKDPVVSGVTNKSGNVITDADGVYGKDNVPTGTTVTTVNGKAVSATDTTVITGDHGTLTIAKDGSYTYKPTANVTNIGKSEVFSYTVTDPVTGKTDTANLIIHIGTASDLAVKWDAANPQHDATTVVATDNSDTIGIQATNAVSVGAAKSISYSWSIGLFGITLGKTSGTTDITVAKGTIENVNITFGSSQLVSLLGTTNVNVKDATGKIVASTNASSLVDVIGILPNGNALSIPGLKEGKYTIEIVSNSGLLSVGGNVNASITRSVIDLDDFTAKSLATQTKGNLLTDNDGHGVDVLASKYTDLYISKDGGLTYTAVTSTGVTVKGAHGDLTIKSDGSYTYSVTDSAFKVGTGDQFAYKLVAPNGDTSVAHLNIETGYEYNTSIGNDVIKSSAGNDVYTTNAGADTVIFKLLNTAEATGGNGHDTWTDFKKADGDKIDISELLQGQNVTAANIGNYVSVAKDGHGNTIISIDRDGQGSTFNGKTELLTLKNTDVTLQELLDNNHLIYH